MAQGSARATEPLYDRIGLGYGSLRRAEPQIAAAIQRALGDAISVVNVGAGAGSYEPTNRKVVAVEPSAVMIAQRPSGAAPAIQAQAEELPLPDGSVDAAMAVFSDHHWSDRGRGLREMRRVARRRALVYQWDQSYVDAFWLTRDYLPGFRSVPGMSLEEIARHLGATRIEAIPVPHDCVDGFFHAYWRRPHAYLDERIRAGTSVFARLPTEEVAEFLARLRDDLSSGSWSERNREILGLPELDLGHRLIVADYEL